MGRKIIWYILISVLVIGIVIYLFGSHGPIKTHLGKDMSLLIFPVVGFVVIELVAGFVSLTFGRGIQRKALFYLLNGVACGFLLYCLFDRAYAFYNVLVGTHSDSSFLTDIAQYLPAIKSLNIFMVFFVAGITLYIISAILEQLYPKWEMKQAGEAFGLMVMGFAMWGMVHEFHGHWHPLAQVAWIPFTACALIALGRISSYGVKNSNVVFSDVCSWFEGATVTIVVLDILLGMYLAVIRPEWIDNYRYAPLVDWGIVVSVVCYVYWNARSGLGVPDASPLMIESWRKHMQQIETRIGREFEQLSTVQKRFVEEGERGPLLVHLAILLGDNEWPEDRIYMELQPLINHKDITPSRFSFRWKKRRIKRQNQKIRKQIVSQIVSGLEPEKITRNKIGHRRTR